MRQKALGDFIHQTIPDYVAVFHGNDLDVRDEVEQGAHYRGFSRAPGHGTDQKGAPAADGCEEILRHPPIKGPCVEKIPDG